VKIVAEATALLGTGREDGRDLGSIAVGSAQGKSNGDSEGSKAEGRGGGHGSKGRDDKVSELHVVECVCARNENRASGKASVL
jgi:hypothetical protein